jgi:flagellar motor switch/type III secretory pathway protein FliN
MASAYPWGALEPVSRAATRTAASARQALRLGAHTTAQSLSELLELPCELVVRRVALGHAASTSQAVWLRCGVMALGILAEPALSAFLAARVLRRSEPLTSPAEPLSPALAGLIAALAVESLRRSGSITTLLAAPPIGEEALLVDATLVLEGRPFSLTCLVVGALSALVEPPRLERLGSLVLSLPLVVASLSLERRELLSLEVGGALLTDLDGSGPLGVGAGLLVAPRSERGIGVTLQGDGRLVVGETAQVRLTVEPENQSQTEAETLADVVLDTPLVVRIELGAVSMTAREWARLGPGDVIETAQRIAEPVVLRVAGREVGRGELVNIDGQVGVRIQKLYEAGS